MKISTKEEREYIEAHATIKEQYKDVTKYEAWLEEQCCAYVEKISQMENEQNLRAASYKNLLTGFHFVLKGMIQQAQKEPAINISKINAYKDCLLKFEGLFKGRF